MKKQDRVEQQKQAEPAKKALPCVGFDGLKDWQIERYRQAVDENRWYLSQRKSCWIDWSEAEQDFLEHGYYGCAEQWRSEYCGHICEFRSNCLLALMLLEKTSEKKISKAG